jgi:hypothetical protein
MMLMSSALFWDITQCHISYMKELIHQEVTAFIDQFIELTCHSRTYKPLHHEVTCRCPVPTAAA